MKSEQESCQAGFLGDTRVKEFGTPVRPAKVSR
jgi:hypothetical protein